MSVFCPPSSPEKIKLPIVFQLTKLPVVLVFFSINSTSLILQVDIPFCVGKKDFFGSLQLAVLKSNAVC